MPNYIEISIMDGDHRPQVRSIEDPEKDSKTRLAKHSGSNHDWGQVYESDGPGHFLICGEFGNLHVHPDNPYLYVTMIDPSNNNQLKKALAALIENHKRQLRALTGSERKHR